MKRKKNLFTVSSIYSVQMLTASPQYRLSSTQLIGSKAYYCCTAMPYADRKGKPPLSCAARAPVCVLQF